MIVAIVATWTLALQFSAVKSDVFSLVLQPIEQLEGGPIVIRAIFANAGDKPVWIVRPNSEEEFAVVSLDKKAIVRPLGFVQRKGLGFTYLAPKQSIEQRLYLHQSFPALSAGPHEIICSWKCYYLLEKPRNGKRIEKKQLNRDDLQAVVHCNIMTWNNARSTELLRRVRSQLQSGTLGDAQLSFLSNALIDTRHPELAELTNELFRLPLDTVTARGLLVTFYRAARSTERYTDTVIDSIKGLRNEVPFGIFGYWAFEKGLLLDDDKIAKMLASDDILMPLLVYCHFYERLDQQQRSQAISRVSNFKRPSNPENLQNLMQSLDSAHFRVRDQSRKELLALGDVALELLCSYRPASAEAQHQVEAIIKDIKGREPLTFDRGLVIYLDLMNTGQSRDLMRALSKGPPEVWLTKEAKQRLSQERSKLNN